MQSSRGKACVGAMLLVAGLLVGCAGAAPSSAASPIAGCPITEAEIEVAIGGGVESPTAGLPHKNMISSCSFGFGPLTTASIQFLVFDTEGMGSDFWDEARPDYPDAVDLPDVGGAAFVTSSPRSNDLFAAQGDRGLHISVYKHDPLPVEQLAALAKAALARL